MASSQDRHELRVDALFLMFAHDKVSPRGPAVCSRDFGASRTFKLELPAEMLYTVRNAAELFFAARAPVAFFGNLRSTFSKGVALLRGQHPSFAYDCAWNSTVSNASASAVLRAHAGFTRLRPLLHTQCSPDDDDDSERGRARRWVKRGSPPL